MLSKSLAAYVGKSCPTAAARSFKLASTSAEIGMVMDIKIPINVEFPQEYYTSRLFPCRGVIAGGVVPTGYIGGFGSFVGIVIEHDLHRFLDAGVELLNVDRDNVVFGFPILLFVDGLEIAVMVFVFDSPET